MFIRTNKKRIVLVDKSRFYNDVDFYKYLWKIKYNIKLNVVKTQNVKNDIIENILSKEKYL